jgi:hypothetical protein
VYKPLSLDILSPHFLYQPFLLFPIQGYPPDSPSSQKCVLLFDVFSPPAKKATFSFMFFPVLVQHRNLKLGGFSDIFPIEKLRISLHVFFPCTSSMGVGIRSSLDALTCFRHLSSYINFKMTKQVGHFSKSVRNVAKYLPSASSSSQPQSIIDYSMSFVTFCLLPFESLSALQKS